MAEFYQDVMRALQRMGWMKQAILDFLSSTYTGAAELLDWDPKLTQVLAPTSAGG